jgi:hypothetical protein
MLYQLSYSRAGANLVEPPSPLRGYPLTIV